MSDELAVITDFQKGDISAFEKLVHQYQNSLTAIAYCQTGDFARSEDLAQQAFVTAWKKQAELEQPAKFGSWLRGILRNLIRNEFRKQKPVALSQLSPDVPVEVEAEISEPIDQVAQREQADLLWTTLESIPEIYRETLVLYYRESNSIASVAKALDVSEDTVKQRLSRGRKMLKQEIADLVESTLESTRPGSSFAAGVLAALPAAAGQAAVAGAAKATAIKSTTLWGGLKMSGAAMGLFGAIFGSLIGIAGGVYGSKRSLDSAESSEERAFIWKMIIGITFLVLILTTAVLMVSFYVAPGYRWIGMAIIWPLYAVLLTFSITYGNKRIAEIKRRNQNKDK